MNIWNHRHVIIADESELCLDEMSFQDLEIQECEPVEECFILMYKGVDHKMASEYQASVWWILWLLRCWPEQQLDYALNCIFCAFNFGVIGLGV